jgi:ketosteroid isomerase-like protein
MPTSPAGPSQPRCRFSSQALARAEARQTLAWLLEAAVLDTERTMPEESTTPDLVERWRELLEAANHGEPDTSRLLSSYAPDAVFEVVALGTTFEGVDAIRGFLEDWIGSYEEFKIDVEEIRSLGNGIALAVFVMEGRPAGSTGHVRYRIAQVSTWVNGVIGRVTGYNDADEARAAAERLAEERG